MDYRVYNKRFSDLFLSQLASGVEVEAGSAKYLSSSVVNNEVVGTISQISYLDQARYDVNYHVSSDKSMEKEDIKSKEKAVNETAGKDNETANTQEAAAGEDNAENTASANVEGGDSNKEEEQDPLAAAREEIEQLKDSIKEAVAERDVLMKQWDKEKNRLSELQRKRQDMEDLKLAAVSAERSGDYGKVAEIRYGKMAQTQKRIDELSAEMASDEHHLINESVTPEDIAEVVAKWTGIPVKRMLESEKEKLLRMEEELHKRVVGQDEAIRAVSDAVRRSRAGLQNEKRPIGSFLFMGTTGVGKTELAKALAEFLFNDENLITRIDMSEYQERHSVSRLVGAPPGYVGYDEGGQLTEAVRRKPYSVVLLDEIEKAHPDVFNILLQVLDDGRLTDNKGRTVDFKNTILIMTSNVGAEIIQDYIGRLPSDAAGRQAMLAECKAKVVDVLKQTVRPEFLNRIDEIIMFQPLSKSDIKDILHIQMKELADRLEHSGVNIDFSERFVDYMSTRGYDPAYGARPIKRLFQRELVNLLAKGILEGRITKESAVMVDVRDGKIEVSNRN